MNLDIMITPYTPFYFYNNIFYTEYLGWNLRSSKYILRINPRLRVWKGPILCLKIFKHSTIYVFNLDRGELFLSLNSKNTSNWNHDTFRSGNAISYNLLLKIIQENFQPKIDRKIKILSLGQRVYIERILSSLALSLFQVSLYWSLK